LAFETGSAIATAAWFNDGMKTTIVYGIEDRLLASAAIPDLLLYKRCTLGRVSGQHIR
jgi:hypothetical protein